MTIRVEDVYLWILTCHECHRALSYAFTDVKSDVESDYIICPVCRTINVVPAVGQRIPFQPHHPIW